MSVWSEALRKLAELGESFIRMKDIQKTQAEEITRLRNDNAELRRENARFGERIATLEEARRSTESDVKRVMAEVIFTYESRRKDAEIDSLRKEIPPQTPDKGA